MRDPRGSTWRVWDLHVHTPLSIVQGYGGDQGAVWDRFFAELEALPPTFKVIGINDYIFLDGYRRVLEAKQAGRLQNLDLILPVIELRIDRFAGTDGELRRVNLHAIFSNQLSADTIEQQFLGALSREYRLNPTHTEVTWRAVPTRAALAELGERIIASAPAEKRRDYGDPLKEGFSARTVTYDGVLEALKATCFRDRVITAVGKAEWASIKWQEGSVADKKTLINGADFVFTAADSPAACVRSKTALAEAGVNQRLLDCSDAHTWSTALQKDRLGQCYTWIKADSEFEGLLQARREPEERVYLGIEPPDVERRRNRPTRYFDRVGIRKVTATFGEHWFDGVELPLNPGLVAVIGNRGSGKSALVDVLGLLGNSQRQSQASFLSAARFRRPSDNKARHFLGELVWGDGARVRQSLDADVDSAAPERVTYVPQKLFDEICNELQGTVAGQFDQELKRVIFSHVDEADRLRCNDLDALLAFRSSEIEASLAAKRERLSKVNSEITQIERQATPEHRRALEAQLALKRQELEVHDARRPTPVERPTGEPDAAMKVVLADMERLRQGAAECQAERDRARSRYGELKREVAVADRLGERLTNLEARLKEFETETEADFQLLGFRREDVLRFQVDRGPLLARKRVLEEEVAAAEGDLGLRARGEARPTLERRLRDIQERLQAHQSKLDEPRERYEDYVSAEGRWRAERNGIVGTTADPESIRGLETAVAALDRLPAQVEALHQQRDALAGGIHGDLRRLMDVYRSAYFPVERFISENEVARERFQLRIAVGIVDAGFAREFLEGFVNRQRAGSFAGVIEGTQRVRELVGVTRFNDENDALRFADGVLAHLRTDHRTPARPATNIAAQLRDDRTTGQLYDFLYGFTYLQVRLSLKMGDRDLQQLSPGEKGALLLSFYLLVDKEDRPLVIDQPEENLDNQTIVSLLVPSLREAKRRRQIIIVTHNPNLAVVCDADQIIHASRLEAEGNRIVYVAGAIENPALNRHGIDVLEGTRVAFDNRGSKYLRD